MEDHGSDLPNPESRTQICEPGSPWWLSLFQINKDIHNYTLNAVAIEAIQNKKNLKQLDELLNHSTSHYVPSLDL